MIDVTSTKPATRLLLCGGGPLPQEALTLFGDWAGAASARVLVVAWASQSPEDAFERNATALCEGGVARAEASFVPPRTPEERLALLSAIDDATGVFFTGGDQNRVMDALDPELAGAFHASFARGVPFGGTSAGTAIMSPVMIAGARDPRRLDSTTVLTRPGLGLLPGTIVDQHFLRRRRHNRLFAVLLEHEDTLGLGVDEGAAFAAVGGTRGTALGGQVLTAVARKRELTLRVLEPGEEFSLGSRTLAAADPCEGTRLDASAVAGGDFRLPAVELFPGGNG